MKNTPNKALTRGLYLLYFLKNKNNSYIFCLTNGTWCGKIDKDNYVLIQEDNGEINNGI